MTSRSELKEEIRLLKDEMSKVGEHIGNLRRSHGKLLEEIERKEQQIRMLQLDPRVSDHALLRYIQRRMGLDLDAIREGILSNGVREAIKYGALEVQLDGFKFMVSKEGCITTVLAPGMVMPERNG